MLEPSNNSELAPIPNKRYFTIGEVSELCAVERWGNRRYCQRHDVMPIRQIRSLLYEQDFTGDPGLLVPTRAHVPDMTSHGDIHRTAWLPAELAGGGRHDRRALDGPAVTMRVRRV